ncbi:MULTISPECIES: hypothetical protein [unclassified Agarivorans]|uniref:hypothetical protein n=1 Tax=unclassified Agarivorans TaxID=2636026 RepID=UPI0026E22404|nr:MULTISPECIES: hypothetical protein [unclassified Agarivorans]MDO6685863.1 hypothetical protein [Agarivorans sp. 3_MG-2023]MDO6716022.1 hypothetical protein [Agarivorans sp. 2_MG-2023]
MLQSDEKELINTQIVSSDLAFKSAPTTDFSTMLSIVVVLLVVCVIAFYLSNRNRMFIKKSPATSQDKWHLVERIKLSDSTSIYIVSDGQTQWPIAESSKNIEVLASVKNREHDANIHNE